MNQGPTYYLFMKKIVIKNFHATVPLIKQTNGIQKYHSFTQLCPVQLRQRNEAKQSFTPVPLRRDWQSLRIPKGGIKMNEKCTAGEYFYWKLCNVPTCSIDNLLSTSRQTFHFRFKLRTGTVSRERFDASFRKKMLAPPIRHAFFI